MNVVLVTSKLHFVPNNYCDFTNKLASNENVRGLIVLNNNNISYLFKSIAMIAMGTPRLGHSLFKNYFISKTNQQKTAFEKAGKKVWELDTINCDKATQIIKTNDIDLIINARTRFIYKEAILKAPRLGCLNIHHGLLPDQRGTMCDLWALYQKKAAGFSIHMMNKKIDDGKILTVKQVAQANIYKSYIKYLLKSQALEVEAIEDLLNEVAQLGQLPEGKPNLTRVKKHFKNPDFKTIRLMKKAGVLL